MLVQKRIERGDIGTIIRVWRELFPSETLYTGFRGMNCFEYSFEPGNVGNHRYYLYYDRGEVVGMSGTYDEPHEQGPHRSAWLGWFGVLGKYRNRGYGRRIVRFFEDEARRCGYAFCRVYTEDSPDNEAISFYEKCGYTFEKYDGAVPADCDVDGVLVGSKALGAVPLVPWANREIYFE